MRRKENLISKYINMNILAFDLDYYWDWITNLVKELELIYQIIFQNRRVNLQFRWGGQVKGLGSQTVQCKLACI